MKIDICVLTETKKKGKGTETVGEYIHIFSSVVNKETRAKRGVSLAIHKRLKTNIKSWDEIDEQIIKVEIHKNHRQMIIIGVYAPSDDADPLTKDMFFNKLTHIISDIKHDKELFLLGDFNSRTGTETNSPVVGQYGERTINNNDLRLRGMCESLNLKIMNGFFPHRDIHKFTWTQPTRQLRSIID
ncbi:craniofacial development protein 2-like [Sitophilus oryzae]|uniref:Craniofacial development protein 2-like n=1 Tax=Sitophilus oryzae TaxID=7048 RepID=A0A6J2YUR1_SITOR|nr:craniofacial development protein 2-like [Sitophilus oryzae]